MHVVIAVLMFIGRALGMSGRVAAQGGDFGTFVTPFPENDRYRVQVIGDAMSSGLLEALKEEMAQTPRFEIDGKHYWLSGLLKSDIDQQVKQIAERLKKSPPNLVVIMLGVQDRLSMRIDGRRANVGSTAWKAEYSRRIDLLMRTFRDSKVGVIWVGLPVMRREDVNEDAQMMNELFRARTLVNGARFIDIHASFADQDGSYDPYGPDVEGKSRRLRDRDGVHFSWHGSRKLAHFVERELKRVAQMAWDERTIPLVGNEEEQARIRPPSTVKLAPLAKPLAGAGGAGSNGQPAIMKQAGMSSAAPGGIAAENTDVTLNLPGNGGQPQSFRIEILRPA
ncbi:MAG: GDSL-type esterase/lipase family protein, partial [Hyphomicrobiaceae bacterium]